jgi:hypothetical protein
MAEYIVYTSEQGHSQRYAQMLSDELSLPLISLEKALKELEPDTCIIYMGWLCANSVKGYKKASKRFKISEVIAVGLCPTGELTDEVRKKNNIPSDTPLFTVQGGMDRHSLKGINKFMINTLIKLLKKNRNPSEEDREKLRLIEEGGDFVSRKELYEVIRHFKEK